MSKKKITILAVLLVFGYFIYRGVEIFNIRNWSYVKI